MITGHGICEARLIALLSSLDLKAKHGLNVSRAVNALKVARSDYFVKGRTAAALAKEIRLLNCTRCFCGEVRAAVQERDGSPLFTMNHKDGSLLVYGIRKAGGDHEDAIWLGALTRGKVKP